MIAWIETADGFADVQQLTIIICSNTIIIDFEKLRVFMKKSIDNIRAVPAWGWLFGLAVLGFEYGIYLFGTFLCHAFGFAKYVQIWKIPQIDDLFPFIPSFILIYVFSYVFWVGANAAITLTDRKNLINYVSGLFLALFIGFLFFIFVPTAIDRTAEGLLTRPWGHTLIDRIYEFIISTDGKYFAFNMFPSFHCLMSMYAYMGIKGRDEITKGYRIYTLIMANLIFLSTLLTKQHYIVDVIGGAGLAVICSMIMERIDPGSKLEHRFEK